MSHERNTARVVPTRRTEIVVGADEHRVNDAVFRELVADPNIYTRGGKLVRVVRGRHDGPPSAELIPQPSLREMLSRSVKFVRCGDDKIKRPAHPPDWCVSALSTRADLTGVRRLAGIVTSPVLRPDGTVLDCRGYDPQTGLLLEARGEILRMPDKPDQKAVTQAKDLLLEVVCDFPFAAPEHQSAWLATILTLVARPAIVGDVPAIMAEANTPGAGKGLLLDCATMIATGCAVSRSALPRAEDEMRKVITSVAIAGSPVVLFDNVKGKIESPSLEAALTCQGLWSDRILSRSEVRGWPLRTVWLLSANNASLSTDLTRRVLPIRLRSDVEHPDDRAGFRHADLLAWVRQERPRLLRAALTVLRAWYVAGCPQPATPLDPWGSFESWSRIVRGCIQWLGLDDPVRARRELRERADVDRDALLLLYATIRQMGTVSAAECAGRAATTPDLAGALEQLRPLPRGTTAPTPAHVGYILRSLRDRVVGDYRLEAVPGHAGTTRWAVRPIFPPTPTDDHHRNHDHPPAHVDGGDGGDGNAYGESAAEDVR